MTYQYPLSVRYDEEGRPDGLKETLNVVVSSISASDWQGLPTVGGGIAVTSVLDRQIYFRNDAAPNSVSGIPLPNPSGYLFASATDDGVVYSWEEPEGTGITPATTLNDLTDVSIPSPPTFGHVLTYSNDDGESAWRSKPLPTPPDVSIYVPIDAAEANQIYVNNNTGTGAVGIPPQVGFLTWTGEEGGYDWQTPVGTEYPTESPTAVSVWYLSGISSIALSATSSTAVTTSVFTGPRQVVYTSESNVPTSTDTGTAYQVLTVNPFENGVNWFELTSLPALTAVQTEIDTIENNLETVSSNLITVSGDLDSLENNFNDLITSAAEISSVVNTIFNDYTTDTELNSLSTLISNTYVSSTEINLLSSLIESTYVSATELNNYTTVTQFNNLSTTIADNYVSAAGDVMTGRLDLQKGLSAASTCYYDDVVVFRDETEGLSAIDLQFKVADLASYFPFDYAPTSWRSYIQYAGAQPPFNSTSFPYPLPQVSSASSNLQIGLSLLDHWVYKHVNGYNNGNSVNVLDDNASYSTTQPTHWSLSGISGALTPIYDGRYFQSNQDATINFIEFNLDADVTREEGKLYWNDDYKTLELDSANQTSMYLGQEVSIRVINNTGTTLNKGQVVYVSGVNSNVAAVALASASAEATTHRGMGVLKQTLDTGDRGLMIMFGYLSGVDTSLYQSGEIVYLGTTPGLITNVYASAFSHPELIGSVVNVGTSDSGSILVHIQHGYEITELHNVSRTHASATGQILVWNEPGNYYEPKFHNDIGGLTEGNPHTQYATLSGANFVGGVSAVNVSATTYLNLPVNQKIIPVTILNPSSVTYYPLFYAKYIENIAEINSVIVDGTSVTWSMWLTSDVSDPTTGTQLYDSKITDSTTTGNIESSVSLSEGWVVLEIVGSSGPVKQLNLSLIVY